ncbi:hypothetical protein [Nocardioides daejeonensis]|uniref:hypothetical protein n=1 Tax=Nocardioides daejeonensis TaxID=1046556 RepID=UPI0013A58437|nr:hypothetical protein [Nocardioides daejeonensis]
MSGTTPNPRRRGQQGGARPRRLAGHATRRPENEPSPEASEARPEPTSPRSPGAAPRRQATTSAPELVDTTTDTSSEEPGGLLASARTTRVLAGVLALLVVGAVVLAWLHWGGDDEPADAEAAPWQYVAGQAWKVPERPVRTSFVEWRAGVDATAKAVTDVLTVNWKTYDEHLAQVKDLVTERFLADYEKSAASSREEFLAQKADYQFEVVNQAVVSATSDEVNTLLFLNQYVTKGDGTPEVFQVRVISRALRDGDTWQLDSLEPF